MDLARRAGINNVQLSKLERGVTQDITGTTLKALCQVLGVSPAYILGMTDDMGVDSDEEDESQLAGAGA